MFLLKENQKLEYLVELRAMEQKVAQIEDDLWAGILKFINS